MTERVTDGKLQVLAAYRYLADGTKIGVTNEYGDGYEYLGSLIYRHTPSGLARTLPAGASTAPRRVMP